MYDFDDHYSLLMYEKIFPVAIIYEIYCYLILIPYKLTINIPYKVTINTVYGISYLLIPYSNFGTEVPLSRY